MLQQNHTTEQSETATWLDSSGTYYKPEHQKTAFQQSHGKAITFRNWLQTQCANEQSIPPEAKKHRSGFLPAGIVRGKRKNAFPDPHTGIIALDIDNTDSPGHPERIIRKLQETLPSLAAGAVTLGKGGVRAYLLVTPTPTTATEHKTAARRVAWHATQHLGETLGNATVDNAFAEPNRITLTHAPPIVTREHPKPVNWKYLPAVPESEYPTAEHDPNQERWDDQTVRNMLTVIPAHQPGFADNNRRRTKIVWAIHEATNGQGIELAREWLTGAPADSDLRQHGRLERKWSETDHQRITRGTLAYHALEHGYQTPRNTSNSDHTGCLLYTSPSPRDRQKSRMPSSA